MIDGMIIVNAVVRPWNMSPENQNPAAQAQICAVNASLKLSYDRANAHYILQPDELSQQAGVTSVKVRQTLDKLCPPDHVNRRAA